LHTCIQTSTTKCEYLIVAYSPKSYILCIIKYYRGLYTLSKYQQSIIIIIIIKS